GGRQRGRSDDRDLRAGEQDRGVHRPDAALRHPRAGADRADRVGARADGTGGRLMTTPVPGLVETTRPLLPETLETLAKVKPGDRIRITHTVRITSTRWWTATVTGTFRELRCLQTGLATDRRLEDDIIVPTVHFTKHNGELSSVALDEQTKI